jgi:glycyl-radical enzyme activating protein
MIDGTVSRVSGRIFAIQRFSIHDGPGIRTTVFMKGCPLRCLWCHNPEGIAPQSLLSFVRKKCIRCGYCLQACVQGAHSIVDDEHVLNREKCIVCGTCSRECYSGALEVVGREASVGEVMATVVLDHPFYETSGGGMTLSGGEPTFQIDFCEALLRAAKGKGLKTCVETCGFASFERFERLLPLVDLFLFDLKETNSDLHRQYTGVDNNIILDNLRRLHDSETHVLLRCPIVPGLNDRADHFDALAQIATGLHRLEGVEIMPYHILGADKRERLGLDPGVFHHVPGKATVEEWSRRLAEAGVRVIGFPV